MNMTREMSANLQPDLAERDIQYRVRTRTAPFATATSGSARSANPTNLECTNTL
jgi:hypothetical protein